MVMDAWARLFLALPLSLDTAQMTPGQHALPKSPGVLIPPELCLQVVGCDLVQTIICSAGPGLLHMHHYVSGWLDTER